MFDVTAKGLNLSEIAPGVDVRRDVLDVVGFELSIAEQRSTWNASLRRPLC